MAKDKAEDMPRDMRERAQGEGQVKEGRVEYFEKFSGMGRILQTDVTTIPFNSRRTTYSVKEGDVVNYRLEMGTSGWQAVDITKKP